MTTPQAHGADVATHHEESDINPGAIVGFGLALTLVAIVMYVAVYLLMRHYERGVTPVNTDYTISQQVLPASPRLQTNPREDLRQLRAQEDAVLGSYGWANRNAGEVRIPIEQAMKLTLQRGLPARTAPAPGGPTSSGDANSGRIVGVVGRR